MTLPPLAELRARIDAAKYAPEKPVLTKLLAEAALSPQDRENIARRAAGLVTDIRDGATLGLMEVFLAEYGLSTEEGVALMCLAEALLRVPDAPTIDALIEDKIAPSNWGKHLGASASSLVNASTWALMLTGKVLDENQPGLTGHLRGAIKRLGEPVIRRAVGRAMKEMGRQFVLGENIDAAMKRAQLLENKGYSYSYDMLGEAARTEADARRYHLSYSRAISAIATACTGNDIRQNPGISVKLSALHPRYEEAHRDRVLSEIVPRVRSLAVLAKSAGMGFNIDAEEAGRLALSMDIIAAVLADPALENWDGFGVVVQAYGPRCGPTIDFLADLCRTHNRRIMVRLVKGAYWDSEIKYAQEIGAPGFPVFTRKSSTDLSYITNARKLLGLTGLIYPQFATHNAHTLAAILEIAQSEGVGTTDFEFQRLHGMGEKLHEIVHANEGTNCRIYAPVGAHRDLLAYLVRRLLENGANSSFVNQIVDVDVAPEVVAADPMREVEAYLETPENPSLTAPADLFGDRQNARGWDLTHVPELAAIDRARAPFAGAKTHAAPLISQSDPKPLKASPVENPADPNDSPGTVAEASDADIAAALDAARPWDADVATRAKTLRRVADLYETNYGRLFALLAREAGKTLADAVSEIREAVDFLRYYADEAERRDPKPAGLFTCIAPWNFPLAIYTGQIAAALAAGNGVLAKPAEQTPLTAFLATDLMHQAGVPARALQFLPGSGARVGAALTSDARINGVCFTGSTATALRIRRAMAQHLAPDAPLIAETGGLNAMIVDSTALPEQAVQSVIESAFQSAGQRCSALRCLYLQEDIAEDFLTMLTGAMAEVQVGAPWELRTDSGPVIDAAARDEICAWIETARREGRLLHEGRLAKPRAQHDKSEETTAATGHFIAPTALTVSGIAEMHREVFGPVLHIARFQAADLDRIIDDINATGYGLTFGLHTRIDDRVQHVVERIRAGNIYVNRNQIGAIVGSQPFGGEGLSGTGPKAGGPEYLTRFTRQETPESTPNLGPDLGPDAGPDPANSDAHNPDASNSDASNSDASNSDLAQSAARAVRAALNAAAQGHARDSAASEAPQELPGPTGESNQLSRRPRPPLLCMGPGAEAVRAQCAAAQAAGGVGVDARGLPPKELAVLEGFSGVVYWGNGALSRDIVQALASRDGAILPLISTLPDRSYVLLETHLCIDTTAAGGNAALLAKAGDA